jgi:hypothetical protein
MISKNLRPHRAFISVNESNILSKKKKEGERRGKFAKLPQADRTFEAKWDLCQSVLIFSEILPNLNFFTSIDRNKHPLFYFTYSSTKTPF